MRTRLGSGAVINHLYPFSRILRWRKELIERILIRAAKLIPRDVLRSQQAIVLVVEWYC